MLSRAYENLTLGNRGRAETVIVQRILREYFKLGSGLDDRSQAIFIGHVDLSISQHRRTAVGARLNPLLSVDLHARPGVQTPHDAAVVDYVKILSVSHRRRHIRTVLS